MYSIDSITAKRTKFDPEFDFDSSKCPVKFRQQRAFGSLIGNHDWIDLKNSIESTLPLTMWFNLTVFDGNMDVLNGFPICNGGAVSNNIVSVDYVCASQNSTFTVYILQLQLSQVGST